MLRRGGAKTMAGVATLSAGSPIVSPSPASSAPSLSLSPLVDAGISHENRLTSPEGNRSARFTG